MNEFVTGGIKQVENPFYYLGTIGKWTKKTIVNVGITTIVLKEIVFHLWFGGCVLFEAASRRWTPRRLRTDKCIRKLYHWNHQSVQISFRGAKKKCFNLTIGKGESVLIWSIHSCFIDGSQVFTSTVPHNTWLTWVDAEYLKGTYGQFQAIPGQHYFDFELKYIQQGRVDVKLTMQTILPKVF